MSELKIDVTGLSIEVLGKAIAIILSDKSKNFNIDNSFLLVSKIFLENIDKLDSKLITDEVSQLYSAEPSRNLALKLISSFIEMQSLAFARDNVQESISDQLFFDAAAAKRIDGIEQQNVVNLANRFDEFINTAVDDGPNNGGVDNEEYDNMVVRMALANMFTHLSRTTSDLFIDAKKDREEKFLEAKSDRARMQSTLDKIDKRLSELKTL